jgi:hypothetical protein
MLPGTISIYLTPVTEWGESYKVTRIDGADRANLIDRRHDGADRVVFVGDLVSRHELGDFPGCRVCVSQYYLRCRHD